MQFCFYTVSCFLHLKLEHQLEIKVKKSTLKMTQTVCLDSPWIVETSELPSMHDQPKFMPTLSNGLLATTVFRPTIRQNCLYNGNGWTAHRARLDISFVFYQNTDDMIKVSRNKYILDHYILICFMHTNKSCYIYQCLTVISHEARE